MRETGVFDTMWDIIVASFGAVVVSFLGFIYLKFGKGIFVKNLVLRFERFNRKFRRRKRFN